MGAFTSEKDWSDIAEGFDKRQLFVVGKQTTIKERWPANFDLFYHGWDEAETHSPHELSVYESAGEATCKVDTV